MKKVLVIDNYDSFIYNLIHYLEELNCEVEVMKNDKINFSIVENYHKILLSPGPGLPSEAGSMMGLIKRYHTTKSLLGVCLGHQAIGEFFGGKLENLSYVYHGVGTKVKVLVKDESLFQSITEPLEVGRYHSWVVAKNSFPEELEITSVDEQEVIMSFRHRKFDVKGVQFHPESILTPQGKIILQNWVRN